MDPFYQGPTMEGGLEQMMSPYPTSYIDNQALLTFPLNPVFMGDPTVNGGIQTQSPIGLDPVTTGPSSYLGDAGNLCTKLKETQSWNTFMAFLKNTSQHPFFDTGGDLLSHFCVPKSGLPRESRPQSPTLPSQVRNSRFKEGIEAHLLAPLFSGSVIFLEDAIVKGIGNATKAMLAIGAIRCLRDVEEYLLSLDQVCSRP